MKANYLKLLLIRHGESIGNVDQRLEGQLSTALSAKGQWQTARLVAYLNGQTPPTHLYSSPLQRSIETARPLEQMTGCSLQLESALQELHQGIFQGLTWAEATQRYPDVCAQLVATLDYRPVPGAETLMSAYQRAFNWYNSLWKRHDLGDVIWVVTHGGFMQQLIRVILGCDRTWQIPLQNTALFEFWLISPTTTAMNPYNLECWKIVKFNETPHLTDQNQDYLTVSGDE